MYVADMDLADANATYNDLADIASGYIARGFEVPEQLRWDLEDVEGRIKDLKHG